MSRPRKNAQGWLTFQDSNLAITREYFRRYERISKLLDENPRIVDLVYRDVKVLDDARSAPGGRGRKSAFRYTAETVLRIIVCQQIENLSLRDAAIRIDDSHALRVFTGVGLGPMMDFSTLCRLRKAIRPQTWRKINQVLAQHAVEKGLVSGERLRMDTTAVETHIHWPSDSALLWDTYRVLGRLIVAARRLCPRAVGKGRLRLKNVKRHFTRIARDARGRVNKERLRRSYEALLGPVESILEWSDEVAVRLSRFAKGRSRSDVLRSKVMMIVADLQHFGDIGKRIVHQTVERVLEGNTVPATEKVFSLFEEHTEMLVRGKAARNIEYGHMVGIEQVESKFITHYDVFEKRPNEHELLPMAIDRHQKLFGENPDVVSADKGYWPGLEGLAALEKEVDLVAIGKIGKRNAEEDEREWAEDFRAGQRFRAGIEGTISFLKRVLGLARCLRKGWEAFVSNVGATVFAHNLLVLVRC